MRKQGIVEATVEAHVAFHDVDVAGVVWHGHYLKYLENARWALMARLDFGLEAMIASGYAWPIVDVHVKYVHAARFNDRLCVQASLVEWENRLAVNYLVTNAATTERVARARTVQVAVDASTGVLQFATPAVLLQRVTAATRGEKWNDAM
ncbi:MAG TPA: acyl-CoA thioesterase [Steroidobacteraceae bacterium]|jgi:acyl-CoA thioester hydrolase|nr:acyl-CoA thioesterase [Steroidobacteraceae bacterium]